MNLWIETIKEKWTSCGRQLILLAAAMIALGIYGGCSSAVFGAEFELPYFTGGTPFPGTISNVVTKQEYQWKYRDMGTDQIELDRQMVYFTKSPTEVVWNEPLVIDYVEKMTFDENQVKGKGEYLIRSDVFRTPEIGKIELKEKGLYRVWMNKLKSQVGNVTNYDTCSFYIYVDGPVAEKQPTVTAAYQSTAEVTGIALADLDYGNFTVRITNPTGSADKGTVALLGANTSEDLQNEAAVFFIDYELGAGESRDFQVQTRGQLLNMMMVDPELRNTVMKDGYIQIIKGSEIADVLQAKLITFESDADRDAFRATIPEEKIQKNLHPGDNVLVCNGTPGTEWLKKYMNIIRKNSFTEDHSICTK